MDEQRMKQILHIDTKALLDTLRDIELKLNDYNKQNAIPAWASSVIPRLEILESSISSLPGSSETREASMNVNSIVAEDRLLEKVKFEVEAKTSSLRLAIDSKLSASSMELDRLLKLLQIRPTTSELQKVVLTVQDVDKKLQNVLGNISGTVINSVQQHVAEEMQTIMNKLKETESIQSRGAEQALKNIEHIAADLTAMKAGLQADLDAVDSEIKRSHVNNDVLTLDLNKLKERLDEYERRTNGTLEHLQKEQTDTTSTIDKLSATLLNRIKLIENDVKAIQDSIVSEAEKSQRAQDALSNRIFDVVTTVELFQAEYKDQIAAIRTDIESTNESLQNTINRQVAIQEYIQQLQDTNVIGRLQEHDNTFIDVKADMESMEKKMSEMALITIQLKNDNIDMKAEVDQLPVLLEAERSRVDQVHKDIKAVKDTVKRTNTMLKDAQSQIDDLKSLKDELALVKDHSEHHEAKLKDMGRKITKLLEATDDQDKRMEEAAQLIEGTESKIEQVMNEVKAEFDDKLMLQNAEVEAKISVLSETVSTMSVASSSKKNTRVAPPRASEKKERLLEDDETQSPTPSRPNTANADPDERRKSDSSNMSGKIVELCLNFEEIAAFRGATVLELPGAICSQVAQLAQSAAALYAEMIDAEVIKRTLRGKADEVSYDESIDAKRQQLLDDAISDVRRQVQQRYGQPGMNRLEARDFFLRKYAQALQLAMSKFDQVMVPGQSRLGRIKIPSCIACDRPLLNKVRGDSTTRLESPSRGSYQPYHSSMLDQSTLTASQSTLLEVESAPEYSSPKRRNDATIRLPTTKKDLGKDNKGAYIMRGGFKMPKQGNDEDRLKKIVLPDMFSMTS